MAQVLPLARSFLVCVDAVEPCRAACSPGSDPSTAVRGAAHRVMSLTARTRRSAVRPVGPTARPPRQTLKPDAPPCRVADVAGTEYQAHPPTPLHYLTLPRQAEPRRSGAMSLMRGLRAAARPLVPATAPAASISNYANAVSVRASRPAAARRATRAAFATQHITLTRTPTPPPHLSASARDADPAGVGRAGPRRALFDLGPQSRGLW